MVNQTTNVTETARSRALFCGMHNSIARIVQELDESLTYLQARNPDCQVTFSCIFKRNDSSDLNEKGQAVIPRLRERLMVLGIDYIENYNILFSNLAKDGLHFNESSFLNFV